jgi:hypothetical protein
MPGLSLQKQGGQEDIEEECAEGQDLDLAEETATEANSSCEESSRLESEICTRKEETQEAGAAEVAPSETLQRGRKSANEDEDEMQAFMCNDKLPRFADIASVSPLYMELGILPRTRMHTRTHTHVHTHTQCHTHTHTQTSNDPDFDSCAMTLILMYMP